MRSKPYQALSAIYNDVMDHINYDDWVKYLIKLSRKYVKHNSLLLDLGAGNCRITKIMSQYYPKIVAADNSINMLKADETKTLEKICSDMVNLPFKKKFDLIYSTFDSVNYLLTKKSLLGLFTEVKLVMNIDAVFLFDVCLENNSKKHVDQNSFEGISGDYKYTQGSKYYSRSKIHKNTFIIWKNGEKKIKEVHKQKIHNFNTYFDLIYKAGLKVVNCYDAFTFNNGSEKSDRIQFVVKHN